MPTQTFRLENANVEYSPEWLSLTGQMWVPSRPTRIRTAGSSTTTSQIRELTDAAGNKVSTEKANLIVGSRQYFVILALAVAWG